MKIKRKIAYLEGGDGSVTEVARVVLRDGSGDLDDGREIAGSVVVSRSSPQLLGLGLGGRLRRWCGEGSRVGVGVAYWIVVAGASLTVV